MQLLHYQSHILYLVTRVVLEIIEIYSMWPFPVSTFQRKSFQKHYRWSNYANAIALLTCISYEDISLVGSVMLTSIWSHATGALTLQLNTETPDSNIQATHIALNNHDNVKCVHAAQYVKCYCRWILSETEEARKKRALSGLLSSLSPRRHQRL